MQDSGRESVGVGQSAYSKAAPQREKTTISGLPPLVVGIVTFNSEKVIERTIEAVLSQDLPADRVLVADNASTDGTRSIVAARFPEVEILELTENRGPNPARNRIVEEAGHGLALLLDDDCIPTLQCFRKLVEAAVALPNGAAFGARVVYDEQPEIIQFEGAIVHFVGEAVLVNADCATSEVASATRPVTGLGAGCILVRGTAWQEVGGYDEYLVFGREDAEFVQRLLIAGYGGFVVPAAVVLHDYEPRGFSASFYQVRNRWLVMLGLRRFRTLVLLAPALLIHEVVIAAFMLAQGQIGTYFRANWAVLRSFGHVRAMRRKVAGFRRSRDGDLLGIGPIAVRADLMEQSGWKKTLKEALDDFYAVYWRLIRPLV